MYELLVISWIILKRTILLALTRRQAQHWLFHLRSLNWQKMCTHAEQRVPSKKYVGCRISGEGCVWANFVSLSLTLRPKAGGGVCAEKLMSQKTLLVTTLHLASDTISLDCNSVSRKLFIPPTTNYQLKWCFSASYNLSLKINFAWILQVCLQHAELNAPAPSHPRAKIKAVRRMSLVRSLFITTGTYFSSGIKNAVSRYFQFPSAV